MKHDGPFAKGKQGTYKIEVSNQGNGSTSSPVTLAIVLPNGLTYKSFSGAGWIFDKNTLTFTQNDILEAGSSYPPLTLSVNVSKNVPRAVIHKAIVSGGGSASSTATNLTTTR